MLNFDLFFSPVTNFCLFRIILAVRITVGLSFVCVFFVCSSFLLGGAIFIEVTELHWNLTCSVMISNLHFKTAIATNH